MTKLDQLRLLELQRHGATKNGMPIRELLDDAEIESMVLELIGLRRAAGIIVVHDRWPAYSEVEFCASDESEVVPWAGATPEQRSKFVDLGNRHGLSRRSDGTFVPAAPQSSVFCEWEIFCPITGMGYTTLKPVMAKYVLDLDEARMMFGVPDMVFTCPGYEKERRTMGGSGF